MVLLSILRTPTNPRIKSLVINRNLTHTHITTTILPMAVCIVRSTFATVQQNQKIPILLPQQVDCCITEWAWCGLAWGSSTNLVRIFSRKEQMACHFGSTMLSFRALAFLPSPFSLGNCRPTVAHPYRVLLLATRGVAEAALYIRLPNAGIATLAVCSC